MLELHYEALILTHTEPPTLAPVNSTPDAHIEAETTFRHRHLKSITYRESYAPLSSIYFVFSFHALSAGKCRKWCQKTGDLAHTFNL